MEIKEIEKNKIVEIKFGGKKFKIIVNEFDSSKFTKYLIDNMDAVLSSDKVEQTEDDSELMKYVKKLFIGIKQDELVL